MDGSIKKSSKKWILLVCIFIFALWLIRVLEQRNEEKPLLYFAKSSADFYYGNSPYLDKIIEKEAIAEEWKFISQNKGMNFIKTGNFDFPYIRTTTFFFRNPNNKDILHILTKTWIYDREQIEWAPLAETVLEFNDGTRTSKLLAAYRLWQGDYEIPIFSRKK